MGVFLWTGDHWFDLLQTAGIIGGLIFTGLSLRLDNKTRYIGNLIELTKQHREIWTEIYRQPELARVTDAGADANLKPITMEEELFINFLILHLSGSFHAMKSGVFISPEGLRKDIQTFFSLPLVKIYWERAKTFQDAKFVSFVEECRN